MATITAPTRTISTRKTRYRLLRESLSEDIEFSFKPMT